MISLCEYFIWIKNLREIEKTNKNNQNSIHNVNQIYDLRDSYDFKIQIFCFRFYI